ncbi:hypothetical protein HG530_011055 [Fusarium avenaceum]|nr:hypothetical protein HG530_011055 [Fusarium avenaceum]
MSTLTLQRLSLPLVVASVLILGSVLLYHGYRTRSFYRNLPGPPHSWLFGHLKVMREIAALMPFNCHPQLYYTEITHRYNIQGIFYLDLWPIGPGTVVITDPKLIELAPVPKPLPVHPQTDKFLSLIVGKGCIAALSGGLWKKMHNAMSPAFSPTHVRNLTGVMIDETVAFISQLERLSATGEIFSMEEALSKVLFDIVARVVFNVPLHAQTTGSQVHADLRALVNLARQETDIRVAYNPVIQISRRWRRRQVFKRLESSLLDRIYNRLELLLSQGAVPSRQNPTSILDLILRDTSTNALSYLFMLLSKAPDVVEKIHEEHVQVLGTHPQTTLRTNPETLHKLPYTEAVIKESLRLFPSGSSLHQGPPGATVYHNGQHFPIDNDLVVTTNGHGIHNDPSIYPDPTTFRPERWLGPDKVSLGSGYFRPFGGDGRSCPGQGMGMSMLKVIVVMTVGDYTFECAGLKPSVKPRTFHTDLDVTFGDIVFQQLGLEGRPRDGMMMTVKKRTEVC